MIQLVVPICRRERTKARTLFAHMANHALVPGCPVTLVTTFPASEDEELMGIVRDLFDDVVHLELPDSLAPYPLCSNDLFIRTARWLDRNGPGLPWYWFEVDNLPIAPNWLDLFDDAYRAAQSPFLGCVHPTRVAQVNEFGEVVSILGVVGQHMTGTGIYPPDFMDYVPSIYSGMSQSWDIALRTEIGPHAAHTDLIQHNWATANYRFDTDGRIICDALNPASRNHPIRSDAAVVHGCKDDSLTSLYPWPTTAASQ